MKKHDLPSLRNKFFAFSMIAPVLLLIIIASLTILAFKSDSFRNLLFLSLGLGLIIAVFVANEGERQISKAFSDFTTATRQYEETCASLEKIVTEQNTSIASLETQLIALKTENEKQIAQNVQDQAAGQQAIETIRQLNERNTILDRELTLLKRVIAATASDLEVNDILEVVCDELVRAFGVDQSAAALLDESGETLTVVAECRAETGSSALGVVIPVEGNPATLYVLKHKSPLALADAQNDILLAPVRELMRQRGVVSLLLLPVIVGGQVVGTLGLDSWTLREFTEHEIELAASVTSATARSLELAWTVEKLVKSG